MYQEIEQNTIQHILNEHDLSATDVLNALIKYNKINLEEIENMIIALKNYPPSDYQQSCCHNLYKPYKEDYYDGDYIVQCLSCNLVYD